MCVLSICSRLDLAKDQVSNKLQVRALEEKDAKRWGRYGVFATRDIRANEVIGRESAAVAFLFRQRPCWLPAEIAPKQSDLLAALLLGLHQKTKGSPLLWLNEHKMLQQERNENEDLEILKTLVQVAITYPAQFTQPPLKIAPAAHWLEASARIRTYIHSCGSTRSGRNMGVALHSIFGMINHSCRPNVSHFFLWSDDSLVELRASVDIPAGSQVFSFLECTVMTRCTGPQVFVTYDTSLPMRGTTATLRSIGPVELGATFLCGCDACLKVHCVIFSFLFRVSDVSRTMNDSLRRNASLKTS